MGNIIKYNNRYFLDSNVIHVFPSAYRDGTIDLESKLNTEKNFTSISAGFGRNVKNIKDSYIISKIETETSITYDVSIHGYYFRFTIVKSTDAGILETNPILKIKVSDLSGNTNIGVLNTPVLQALIETENMNVSNDTGNGNLLDLKIDENTNIFIGLEFITAEDTDADCYYLDISEATNEYIISSKAIESEKAGIPIVGNLVKGTGLGSITQLYYDNANTLKSNAATTIGKNAFVIGESCGIPASNSTNSFAGGANTSVSGSCSFAFGKALAASADYETVIGKYNNNDVTLNRLFTVGNGTYNSRSNALEVYTDKINLKLPTEITSDANNKFNISNTGISLINSDTSIKLERSEVDIENIGGHVKIDTLADDLNGEVLVTGQRIILNINEDCPDGDGFKIVAKAASSGPDIELLKTHRYAAVEDGRADGLIIDNLYSTEFNAENINTESITAENNIIIGNGFEITEQYIKGSGNVILKNGNYEKIILHGETGNIDNYGNIVSYGNNVIKVDSQESQTTAELGVDGDTETSYVKADELMVAAIDPTGGVLSVTGAVSANSVSATGTITADSYNTNSDKRLKENIVSYENEKSILDLDVKKFDFINGAKNQIGCIAQDLQEICPELVTKNENGYLSIQENKLVYLLLNEVKQLKKEIDELKK